LEEELERRGVVLRGRLERSGPCPKCGGTDRFAVHTGKQIFNCRGCQRGGDIIALVRLLDDCTFAAAVEALTGEPPRKAAASRPRHTNADDYETRQAAKAAWLWSQRRPIAGTPAERYLREARGYAGRSPNTLAFLPPAKSEHHPALISAFAICDEPEPGVVGEPGNVTSVHLTLLTPEGTGN